MSRIAMVGSWHLSSVMGACLAEVGHTVRGVHDDAEAIESLSRGKPTIEEPDLEASIRKGLKSKRLSYTTDFEKALRGDFAIIRAEVGDHFGNLRFYGTARNFSPQMAMACTTAVVEVDTLVPVGELAPADVHLSGIFVQRIFKGRDYEDPIEYRTTRPRPAS